MMCTAIDEDVLVHLQVFIAAIDERRRVAHGAVDSRRGYLRNPGTARIARHALQAALCREISAAFPAPLPAADAQPSAAQLVHHFRPEHVRVAQAQIAGARANLAAEA